MAVSVLGAGPAHNAGAEFPSDVVACADDGAGEGHEVD